MDRLLAQLSTFNLAVGAEHESAERGLDDDARVILVAGRNGACDASECRVAGVAVQVDVTRDVPWRCRLMPCHVRGTRYRRRLVQR